MSRRLLAGIAVVASVLMTTASAQQRPNRVALVIGNANYPDASTPLSTTVRDARTVADEFRRSDFDVDLKEDVGKEDMQRAIDVFTGKIRAGTTALFYFNGYGIQVGRQTYIVPLNAQLWTEADVRREAISVDGVLANMHRNGANIKIVILDAARRNPFERRFRAAPAGLAALDAPDGTLAMYSAALGKVAGESPGPNSLFVGELMKEIRAPSVTAEQVFNRTRIGVSRASNTEQVPWVASSLVEEFYFGAVRSGTTIQAQPQVSSPPPVSPPPQAQSQPRPPSPSPSPSQADNRPAPQQPAPPGQRPVSTKPGDFLRDCSDCPELVVVPGGVFNMGSTSDYESPLHRVTIAKAFAIGRREVMFSEWDRCVDDGGCKGRLEDRGWGRDSRPVINVSWIDAKAYLAWLSQKTGETYRLPSEAEWEYAARGGTDSTYWWGRDVGVKQANCLNCKTDEAPKTLPVGSFKANPFGLFDTSGNAAEWVEDCWNDNYRGAPNNGSAWNTGQCRLRVLRGGAFDSDKNYLRSASRFRYDSDVRYSANGFRVLREIP